MRQVSRHPPIAAEFPSILHGGDYSEKKEKIKMTYEKLKETFESAVAAELFQRLYGKSGAQDAPRRYAALADGLAAMEGGAGDMRVFSAPGRTELCGNHTDHNLGKVVAASVQLDVVGIACPRMDKTVVFRSTGFPDAIVDLSDLSPRASEYGTTESLIRGVSAEFNRMGAAVQGFNVCADSTVLKGSGLSSSAAVEVLLSKIYDVLNSSGKTPPLELARIAQKAENVYFGKPCGLMDQAASAIGGAVFMDFGMSPVETEIFTLNLEESGYTLCVADTGSSHADLTPHYAAIPSEMKSVAAFFGKSCLAEVKRKDVLTAAAAIRAKCGDRALLRTMHFFNENQRVVEMRDLLRQGAPISALFDVVRGSGGSSWELLQNVDAAADPREQNVALALALTGEFTAGSGSVYRVHGGGFAGAIQAYIRTEIFPEYQAFMEGVFGAGSVTKLFIRPVGAVFLDDFTQGVA
ncbi:MAG: galactokinase [Treponema sp.]|jgi:galactokinase|nr:galactokinase [Treponema sp.]